MNTRKRRNMMNSYTGHNGPATVEAIYSQIPKCLVKQLTGEQLGRVMDLINKAYHNGKSDGVKEYIEATKPL